jgi:hypothetical protein
MGVEPPSRQDMLPFMTEALKTMHAWRARCKESLPWFAVAKSNAGILWVRIFAYYLYPRTNMINQRVFAYSTARDRIFLIASLIASICAGATLPVMNILFGQSFRKSEGGSQ